MHAIKKISYILFASILFIWACKQPARMLDGFAGKNHVTSASSEKKFQQPTTSSLLLTDSQQNVRPSISEIVRSELNEFQSNPSNEKHPLKGVTAMVKRVQKKINADHRKYVDSLEAYNPKGREERRSNNTGLVLMIVGIVIFLFSYVYFRSGAFLSSSSYEQGCFALMLSIIGIIGGAVLALVGLILLIVQSV